MEWAAERSMRKRSPILWLTFASSLCAATAASAFSSEVDSRALFDGEIGATGVVDCDGAPVLGGGFDAEASILGLEPRASAPASFLGFAPLLPPYDIGPPAGPADAPTDWRVQMSDESGVSGFHSFKGAAICGELPGLSMQVERTFHYDDPDAIFSVTALCPASARAIGSAFAFDYLGYDPNPYDMYDDLDYEVPATLALLGASLLFDAPGSDLRLGELTPGEYGAPYGVSLAGISFTADLSTLLGPVTEGGLASVAAICAELAEPEAISVVAEQGVQPQDTSFRTVRCPIGFTAVGGGVDPVAYDRNVEIVSSGPVFFGFPSATRLWDVPDGDAGAPIGWRGGMRNTGGTPATFKVATICVPEPPATAIGVAASLALATLASGALRATRLSSGSRRA
jgi:hypothetical protein